jgi:hypothetical protein
MKRRVKFQPEIPLVFLQHSACNLVYTSRHQPLAKEKKNKTDHNKSRIRPPAELARTLAHASRAAPKQTASGDPFIPSPSSDRSSFKAASGWLALAHTEIAADTG